ncbi:hypothetical protein [Nocardia sp. 348MFTsu5.1]|uniref:hypothetical protein n=1 Tax=Nocardia sp. 348MFTsu5.1 TaxID=1172185 RepID=UPI000378B557|nr:hypothetical protein [Nocardia sp. 348MFTsu5.1]
MTALHITCRHAFFSEMHNLIGAGRMLDDVAPRDAEVMRAGVRRRPLWPAG